MPSNFPGAIDSFTDPLSNSPLNSPSHSTLHSDINDAVEKVEQYMGLVKVIPTGATNGTVGATGTVTIGNAVSSVSVLGAFSSLYDNYLVQVIGGANSLEDNGRLSLGSAATGYFGNLLYATYSSPATFNGASDNNSSQFSFCWRAFSGSLGLYANITISNPNRAIATFVSSSWVAGSASGQYQGVQSSTTQFTSFTLSPTTGTMTGGTIRVYGYRN